MKKLVWPLVFTALACSSPTDAGDGARGVVLTSEQVRAVIVATEAGRYSTPYDDVQFQTAIDNALIVLRASR